MKLSPILHFVAVSSSFAFTSVNHVTLLASRNPSFTLQMSDDVADKTTEDDFKICLVTGSSRGKCMGCISGYIF